MEDLKKKTDMVMTMRKKYRRTKDRDWQKYERLDEEGKDRVVMDDGIHDGRQKRECFPWKSESVDIL